MKRLGKYNVLLGIAGSVVGIVSLPDFRYVFFVIIGAILIFELYSFHMKYKGMTQDKLNKLTYSLIKKAEKEIVLFGGDISWVDRYVGKLNEAMDSNKDLRVIVYYHADNTPELNARKKVLEKNSIKVIKLNRDYKYRATMIDPESDSQLQLLLSYKYPYHNILDSPWISDDDTGFRYNCQLYKAGDKTPIIDLYKKAHALNKTQISKPKVYEIVGLPSSGKTSSLDAVKKHLSASSIRHKIIRDSSEYNSLASKKDSLEFNLWNLMNTLMIMKKAYNSGRYEVIVIEKGIIDVIPWLSWHNENSRLDDDLFKLITDYIHNEILNIDSYNVLYFNDRTSDVIHRRSSYGRIFNKITLEMLEPHYSKHILGGVVKIVDQVKIIDSNSLDRKLELVIESVMEFLGG